MSVVQYKCPNCGGSLEFKADSQSFKCEYCMSEFSKDEMNEAVGESGQNAADTGIVGEQQQTEFNEHTNLYICDNCGAEIIADENTAATFCYYCHSPVSLKGRLSGQYRPGKVIPFKHTREQALEIYKQWCGKKWFLPKDFVSESQLEKITGLYVPFWLADCKVNSALSGEGHISTSHTQGEYRITHTKVFHVERAAFLDYSKVPADGSKKLDDKLMDAVEPFDYSGMIDFDMAYLSGFFADKYDVERNEVIPRIRDRIADGAMDVLRGDIHGYTSFTVQNSYINLIRTDWQYALLPVWFMTYKHKGKDYFYAMNGQTGKMAGILPVSGAKLAVLGAILFAVFGTLGFLIGGLFL